MSLSIIKILSCSIFIAEKQNNKILSILLKDFFKIQLPKKQYLFILFIVESLKDKNIFINDLFYKIIDIYIHHYGNRLSKYLLYYEINNMRSKRKLFNVLKLKLNIN
jgi:hypothetical protein